jgi:hypothetical protein
MTNNYNCNNSLNASPEEHIPEMTGCRKYPLVMFYADCGKVLLCIIR